MTKSHCVKSLLAGLILAAPAVWAQGNNPPAGPKGDQSSAVAPAQNPDRAAERAEFKALNEKERGELQAVNSSSKTLQEKRAARKALRETYRQERMALRKKYHGDAKPQADIRQDRQQRKPMTVKQNQTPPAK